MPDIGIFWDAGLVYLAENGMYKAICIPARRAMMATWAKSKSLPDLRGKAGTEFGILLEQYVVRQLLSGPRQLAFYELGNLGTAKKKGTLTTFNLAPMFDVVYFHPDRIDQNITKRQCLYVPTILTLHGWDVILHCVGDDFAKETLIFFQVSASSIRKHDHGGGGYLMRESVTTILDKYKRTIVQHLIHEISGVDCETSIDADGNIALSQFSREINCLFVFVVAKTRKQIMNGESRRGAESPSYGNLLVMTSELCKGHLSIDLDFVTENIDDD
jgi:hypothetical protein